MEYHGRGKLTLVDGDTGELKSKSVKRMGMISGGTGVTPMYQLTQAVEEDPIDFTGLSLLSFYQSPIDALLEEDLARQEQAGILSYFPVVESPDEMWVHGEGKVRRELIESFMPHPEDTEGLILISGREAMANA